MRKQTDLEKEFKGFKIKSTYINSVDKFKNFIETIESEIEEYLKNTRKEIKENKRWKFEVKIRNYFLAIFGESEIDVYDEDTDILNEIISIDEDYLDFYNRIINIVNENNFMELLKLAEFANMYYEIHIELLEKQREIIELELRGIHMISPHCIDKRNDLKIFLSKRLNMIEDRASSKSTYKKERLVA